MERFYATISLLTVLDWDAFQEVIRFIAKSKFAKVE
jgi:hypothetical protein